MEKKKYENVDEILEFVLDDDSDCNIDLSESDYDFSASNWEYDSDHEQQIRTIMFL